MTALFTRSNGYVTTTPAVAAGGQTWIIEIRRNGSAHALKALSHVRSTAELAHGTTVVVDYIAYLVSVDATGRPFFNRI